FPLLWYFGLSLITAASRIILTTLYYRFDFYSSFLKMFMQYNSVPVVAASVCLFVFFVNLNIRNRVMLWIIKFFSPAAFGVYLIHEQIEVKNIIWKLIRPLQFIKSPKLLPYLLLVIFSLFIICALLDKIRHLLSVVLHVPQLFGFVSEKISSIFRKAFNKLVPDEGEPS
ncbi:MAG: hypothetical protein IJV76_13325, partial [Clostridia bacterium]|nr:hypothetical protein [Clostridia bacterium]